MPEPVDHIAFLSQEVGPRPAGTEEEQQAALYITEQFQKEAGLSAVIEDFSSESNGETPYMICAAVSIVLAVVQMFFPIVAIPIIILTAIAALLYVAECFNRPILSKFLARGVSQNVVAKYEPAFSPESGGTRHRKIILFANYDSGKVKRELRGSLLKTYPLLQKIALGAMVFIPLMILIKNVFFLQAEGATLIFINVLLIFALLMAAVPVVLFVLHKIAPYNEAASCNASGVAALLEVAKRVAKNDTSPMQTNDASPTIHGEDAAYAEGLVPEGAQLVYEAAQVTPPDIAPQTEEERLLAAKMAIEALTGKSVGIKPQTSVASNLVQVKEPPISHPEREEMAETREETREALTTIPSETLEEAARNAEEKIAAETIDTEIHAGKQNEEALEGAEEEQILSTSDESLAAATLSDGYGVGEPAIPDWYKKAQENAKKPRQSNKKIQRSRYADALDAATSESNSYFNQAPQTIDSETEERLQKMRANIMEASAPQAPREEENFYQQEPAPADTFEERSTSSEEWIVHTEASQESEGQQVVHEEYSDDLGATTGMPPINADEVRRRMDAADASAALPVEQSEELPSFVDSRTNAVVLPEINISKSGYTPIDTAKQQRAPLAVAEESSQAEAAKSLLTMLPSIDLQTESDSQDGAENRLGTSQSTDRSALKSSLPSLSGELRAIKGADAPSENSHSNVSAAGSFAAGATGAIKPVGEELLENVDPEDIYVDDVDDSDYDESYTETGAFAGPGYVDMPKSRVRRIFDKLNFRKSKEEKGMQSASEWLDVDDDFNPQEVGAARGGWESFQQEEVQPRPAKNNRREIDDDWEGGAYSDANYIDEETSSEEYFDEPSRSGEIKQIQQFRSGGINTEVWFVALGSDLANNGGVHAFLAEHESELRGAMFINLCSLGAGDLCYIDKEGWLGKAGTSSRMKRYLKKASQATGIPIGVESMRWKKSPATVVSERGMQAMTLAGVIEGKPAFCAQGDDILENISEEILNENIDFVMELLRSI